MNARVSPSLKVGLQLRVSLAAVRMPLSNEDGLAEPAGDSDARRRD